MKMKTKVYKWISEKIDTANPHHLQVICKLACLLKFVTPKIQYLGAFTVTHEHAWSGSAKK